MNRTIGIDPSLSCTAVVIMQDGKDDVLHCFTTKNTKWVKAIETIASCHLVSYRTDKGENSEVEINKLIDYRANAYEVVDTLNLTKDDHVFIESYASRAKGNIIDLVVFSTFLRERILDSGAQLTIVTPMSLKKTWAEEIYEKDKKGVARNNELTPNSKGEMIGIAGGSFKKHQMMLGLYEMEGTSKFKKEMEMHRLDIMPLKDIPTPFNDFVDAYAAAYLGKKGKL